MKRREASLGFLGKPADMDLSFLSGRYNRGDEESFWSKFPIK